MQSELCPCDSGLAYHGCCAPFHHQQAIPETAEQLMRSRYSAYKMQLSSYLLETWACEHAPEHIEFDSDLVWQQLRINGKKKGRKKDLEGWVTFTASYSLKQMPNRLFQMQEKSYFIKEDGRWYYVTGEVKE